MSWVDDLVGFAESRLNERAREALWTRGVTDEQIQSYRLGYIDRELPPLTYPASFKEWSLGGAKLDDMFLLPLTNALGDIKGMQFRHVERARGGYSDYFLAEDEPVLFGLAQAVPHIWTTGDICLVEGCFDLFPVQRALPGTVATLTARIPGMAIRLFKRFVQRIWMVYDMDGPGRRGCAKVQARHGQDFDVRIVPYPQVPKPGGGLTKDPGELWEAWGEDRFVTHFQTQVC